jgi:vacuolar-type H+-ATPase subunit H
MVAEKSLLQQIREKELTLSIKIDETRREAEEITLVARKEALEMVENSEREGKKAAQEYYEKEMENIKKEIEQLKSQSNQQSMLVRVDGERNLPSAIDKIVKVVSGE